MQPDLVQRLLPHLQEVPAAFEAVGHIAHVNLPDELSPHRFVIGQASSCFVSVYGVSVHVCVLADVKRLKNFTIHGM